jgi:hypothetical protein
MTELLKKAFERVSAELPDYEQDEVARCLIAAIDDDERRWDAVFALFPDRARRLADEALDDYRAGRTKPLDPDKL